MGKWLLDKVGIKGMQWIGRGIAVVSMGLAGWSCWLSGHADGYVDAIDKVSEELMNNK